MIQKASDSARFIAVGHQMLVGSVLLNIFRINLNAHLRVKLYICWFKIVVLNLFWGLLTPLRSSWKQQYLFQEIYPYKHKSCTWFQLCYGSLKSIHGPADTRFNTIVMAHPGCAWRNTYNQNGIICHTLWCDCMHISPVFIWVSVI